MRYVMKKLFGLNRDPMFSRRERDGDCGISPGIFEGDTAETVRQGARQVVEESQEQSSSETAPAAPQPV